MNKKPIIISISIVAAAIVLFLVLKLMKDTALGDANQLPAPQYVASPKSFAGNLYSINIQIESQLAYDDFAGRMLLVKTDCATPLPIFVPSSIFGFNPMAGQKYKFTVKVSGDGMLTLTDFKKI